MFKYSERCINCWGQCYLWLLPAGLLLWSVGAGWIGTHWLVERGTLANADQVMAWARLFGKGFWGLMLLWFLPLLFTRRFYERFVGPATPEALGAIRALICFIMVLWVLREDLGTTALLPESMLNPENLGLLVWLYDAGPWMHAMMRSPTACRVFQGVTVVLLLLGMAGWRTRWVMPLAFFGCLVMGAMLRGYTFYWHQGLVPIYVMGLLCFLPCGAAFSWDRRRRAARGLPVVDPRQASALYGWSRWLIWMLIAITYVMAGASKLRNGGVDWWEPDNMRRMLMIDALGAMNWQWPGAFWLERGPVWMWAVMGFMGIFGELIYGLVPFWKPARWLVPLMTLGMHVGILFIQNILFLDLMLIQAIFYNWRPLADRMWSRIRAADYKALRWVTAANDAFPATAPATAHSSSSPPARSTRWGMPGLGAVILVGTIFVWMQFIEIYPLTGMRMYSNYSVPQTIHYNRVDLITTDGQTQTLDLGDWVNALGQARFRPLISLAFEPEDRRQPLDDFLEMAVPRGNQRLPDGLEVQTVVFTRYAWDYVDDRDSPTFGEPVARYEYHVKPDKNND